MTQSKPEKLSTFDAVEAFHLGHALSTLQDLEVLASLKERVTADELASKHHLDPTMLRSVLEYVAARTDVIRKIGTRFVVTRKYTNASRYLLDLYAGAFGDNAAKLGQLMRRPSLAAKFVDRDRHARAFAMVGDSALGGVPEVIERMQFNHILDIGCGTAALLRRLAAQNPDFIGWGLEANPSMCRLARAEIRSARIGRRVKVLEGDSKRLGEVLPAKVRSKIKAVTACHVANEMFANGNTVAVKWLRKIRKTLPDRPLLISDYYGRLGSKIGCHHRETLLHDYAQLISGQGVPPTNIAEWQEIYADAGCGLVHVIEDNSTTRFIHILVL